MDEHFPNGYDWVFELDPQSREGEKFFREFAFPDAAAFFLSDQADAALASKPQP